MAGSGRRAVAQEVAEEASERLARKTPVVIGENMRERVIPFARKYGYETIADYIPSDKWTMEANEQWLKQMMREGREIIDIGPDFTRRLRYRLGYRDERAAPPSLAYGLERRILREYRYGNYRKAFRRTWKYGGEVAP